MAQNVNYLHKMLDNRYRIEEVIGEGGSACVYRAEDVLLNRTVALKVLAEDKNELALNLRSFDTEAKAISLLSHPNIVNVYDVFNGDGMRFIVMEYIDGITLKRYLKHRGPLSFQEVIDCTKQVLRALREAHGKNLVHRDIKPQNVMVLRDGTIKVADFGIARLPDTDPFRMKDRSIGSVHYISPEQARGEQVDARSDLYSLGILMYEMVTGVRPFEANNPSDVAVMQVTDAPKPPSVHRAELPPALERIILRALEKKPEDRYESAGEMLRALEKMQEEHASIFSRMQRQLHVWTSGFARRSDLAAERKAASAPDPEPTPFSMAGAESDTLLLEETDDTEAKPSAEIGELPSGGEVEPSPQAEKEALFFFDDAEDASPLDDEPMPEIRDSFAAEGEKEEVPISIDLTPLSSQFSREIAVTGEFPSAKESKEATRSFATARLPVIFPEKQAKKTERAVLLYTPDQTSRFSEKKKILLAAAAFLLILVLTLPPLFYRMGRERYRLPAYENAYYELLSFPSQVTVRVEYTTDFDLPNGVVVKQYPEAGYVYTKETELLLYVNRLPGEMTLSIPEGTSYQTVVSALKAELEGIPLTIVHRYEYTDAVPKGEIFAGDYTFLPGGSLILTESLGADPIYAEVPSLIGMSAEAAIARLEALGILYELRLEGDLHLTQVSAQSLEAGENTLCYADSGKILLTLGTWAED